MVKLTGFTHRRRRASDAIDVGALVAPATGLAALDDAEVPTHCVEVEGAVFAAREAIVVPAVGAVVAGIT